MGDSLSELTTLGLGGPAANIVPVLDADELVAAVREVQEEKRPLLLIAGGSNLVVSDAGFDGTVIHLQGRGVEIDGETVTVQAGEPWDALVDHCVGRELAGIEALSGIPGSAGATPIQNVGAYGQEVADTITSVKVYDRQTDKIELMSNADCSFGYRTSSFKRDPARWVVLEVVFKLRASQQSEPIAYAQLADALGVKLGGTAPLIEVREAVLDLRRSKGMVLDPNDLDTRSAGSFFTNPFVDRAGLDKIERAAGEAPPAWPEGDLIKTSAAWLIQRAGFQPGQGDPRGIAISSKHVLALTNRGNGTTEELLAFAGQIVAAVQQKFGVSLEREPTLVG